MARANRRLDRYYQCHKNFDLCKNRKSILSAGLRPVRQKKSSEPWNQTGSVVFYDAFVCWAPRGEPNEKEVRVIAYRVAPRPTGSPPIV